MYCSLQRCSSAPWEQLVLLRMTLSLFSVFRTAAKSPRSLVFWSRQMTSQPLIWESGCAQGFCLFKKAALRRHCRLSACSRWEQLAARVCCRPARRVKCPLLWYGAALIKLNWTECLVRIVCGQRWMRNLFECKNKFYSPKQPLGL